MTHVGPFGYAFNLCVSPSSVMSILEMCWMSVCALRALLFWAMEVIVEVEECEEPFVAKLVEHSGVAGSTGDGDMGELVEKLGILFEESFADDLELCVSDGIERDRVALLARVEAGFSDGLLSEGCRNRNVEKPEGLWAIGLEISVAVDCGCCCCCGCGSLSGRESLRERFLVLRLLCGLICRALKELNPMSSFMVAFSEEGPLCRCGKRRVLADVLKPTLPFFRSHGT